MDGRGTYRFATGTLHVGSFVAGVREGRALLRHADGTGDFDVVVFHADKPAGVGVRWSADRQHAWRLRDGEEDGEQAEISADEARALAAQHGLPAPPPVAAADPPPAAALAPATPPAVHDPAGGGQQEDGC